MVRRLQSQPLKFSLSWLVMMIPRVPRVTTFLGDSGIPDVRQIDGKALITRKVALMLRVTDPGKVQEAVTGILTGRVAGRDRPSGRKGSLSLTWNRSHHAFIHALWALKH